MPIHDLYREMYSRIIESTVLRRSSEIISLRSRDASPQPEIEMIAMEDLSPPRTLPSLDMSLSTIDSTKRVSNDNNNGNDNNTGSNGGNNTRNNIRAGLLFIGGWIASKIDAAAAAARDRTDQGLELDEFLDQPLDAFADAEDFADYTGTLSPADIAIARLLARARRKSASTFVAISRVPSRRCPGRRCRDSCCSSATLMDDDDVIPAVREIRAQETWYWMDPEPESSL